VLPLTIKNIDTSICHKGMKEQLEGINKPEDPLDELLLQCDEQLLSIDRIQSSCIDIPGIIVHRASNPCNFHFRLVDGAHRLCLRKYLLALLHKELMELEKFPAEFLSDPINGKEINEMIDKKKLEIEHYSTGMFFLMDEGTFLSMLTSDDPNLAWAKSKEDMMSEITVEVQMDWNEWMTRVMKNVKQWSEKSGGKESETKRLPHEEL